MEATWSILLLSAKWLLIGLIYYLLWSVLRVVRREMGSRIGPKTLTPAASIGRLKIINPGTDGRIQPGATLPLTQEMILGADPASDLVLSDQYISGRHATLRWDGTRWWLTDLGSKNGTFINEQRLPAYQERALPWGTPVKLGGLIFKVTE